MQKRTTTQNVGVSNGGAASQSGRLSSNAQGPMKALRTNNMPQSDKEITKGSTKSLPNGEKIISPSAVNIIIDLGTGDTMSLKEKKDLLKHLECSYKAFKKHTISKKNPANARLSFLGFDKEMAKLAASTSVNTAPWPISKDSLENALKAEGDMHERRVIYLSPDAEDPLLDVQQGDVIIIGGIVDQPTRPGVSADRAQNIDARITARLPMREFTGLPHEGLSERDKDCATVLSINAVVGALLHLSRFHDWQAALTAALPKRLRPLVRTNAENVGSESSSSTEESEAGAKEGEESTA